MNCKHCNNKFSTKTSLNNHQKTAKYCLKIQNIDIEKSNRCDGCGKTFNRIHHLQRHQKKCKSNDIVYKLESESDKKDISILKYKEKMSQLEIRIIEYKYTITTLQNILHEISIASITDKNTKISHLIKKYVKKQSREQISEKYVIYIITTQLMKKERRYIMGKATNLTNRLSTYNKSDEHEIIFYQSCGDPEIMSCVEAMTFQHLKDHREQANRERFVLPKDKEISFFSNAIKKSIDFFKN
jgi:hypothetical protein